MMNAVNHDYVKLMCLVVIENDCIALLRRFSGLMWNLYELCLNLLNHQTVIITHNNTY